MAVEMISWPISQQNAAGPEDRTRDFLNTSRTCIQPSFNRVILVISIYDYLNLLEKRYQS